jgi:uncharacterized phiE125 gp8 family phage protein
MTLGYFNNAQDLGGTGQWSIRVTTAPVLEPVTTAEAKAHLRVDGSDDDTYIGTLITAAREFCEAYTRRAFITQTITMYLPQFPLTRVIELPKPQLQSVTSLKYYDEDDAQQTWSSSNYRVDATGYVGRVTLKEGISWPDTITDRQDCVQIAYVAGYGTAQSTVPTAIKQAMLLLIGHWYRTRESVAFGTITKEVEFTTDAILSGYKVPSF